jgi:hypothetical protein
MKHATAATLDGIEELLAALRAIPGLQEKARGVFYLRSKAFLHFHEDPAGLFADFRAAGEWVRLPVDTDVARRRLLETVTALAPPLCPRGRSQGEVG